MATYNWTYRPGIPNRYNINIPQTDDDIRPEGIFYVSLFGNDVTGNGSRMKPYKTIKKIYTTFGSNFYAVIFASGTYRTSIANQYSSYLIIGDGDVVFDGENIAWFDYENLSSAQSAGGFAGSCYNITVKNYFGTNSRYGGVWRDCWLDNMKTFKGEGSGEGTSSGWVGNVVSNITNRWTYLYDRGDYDNQGNTYHNVQLYFICNLATKNSSTNNIYSNCKIHVNGDWGCSYSLFYNCEFNFGLETELFKTFNSIDELRAAYKEEYPNSLFNFDNCIFANPKFNNPEIGDYSLAFDSRAKNASYFGSYIGAKSIGYPIKARATENEGDFDFSTAVNVSITDNSIMLTNPEIDASIETKVTANLKGRELAEAPIFGFNADRNGQYIDSLADLSETTVSIGTSLKDLTPYIVEGASITLNGSIYQPGERFTTKDILDFSSDGGGVCREILEAPQRHTIMARFSDGGASKNVGDQLTAGYWYYPISGTINYNGVEYFQKSFKAIDTNSFTTPDGGVLIEAFTNEEYQHYEPGIAFSSNNVGNVRTGEILRGNGDPDYIRGTAFEFPINARFIQLKYIIRVKNLKP